MLRFETLVKIDAVLGEAVKALEFYSGESGESKKGVACGYNWATHLEIDDGRLAREALKKIRAVFEGDDSKRGS
jgi:hypothetical protein